MGIYKTQQSFLRDKFQKTWTPIDVISFAMDTTEEITCVRKLSVGGIPMKIL